MNAHAIPLQTDTPYWSAVFSLFMGVWGFFFVGLAAAVGGLTFYTVGIHGNFMSAGVFLVAAFLLARARFFLHTKTCQYGDIS